MFKNPLNKKSAFTLVELMVTVSLVSLVFIAGTTAVISVTRFYGTEQTKHRANDELTLAIGWIKRDAMQADAADTSVANEVTLRVTNYAAVGHPFITIKYSVTDTTLQRTIGATTTDITNIIDAGNLPTYQYDAANSPNYLVADIHTAYGANTAHQRVGVMLSCRDRNTAFGPLPNDPGLWQRQP